MQLDSRPPSIPLENDLHSETRYSILKQNHPEEAERFLEQARQDINDRWKVYEMWAHMGAKTAAKSPEASNSTESAAR